MKPNIILASASPRRREILKPYFRLQILPSHINERRKNFESPRAYVKRIAREKWIAAAKLFAKKSALKSARVIVAADTTVALKNQIFGKPKNAREARLILQKLSGRKHRVMTAVSVGWSTKSRPRYQKTIISLVKFRKITPENLEAYIRSGEWKDKAGAYAIQGRASKFVHQRQGSLTNIIGLPLVETKSLIVQCLSQLA